MSSAGDFAILACRELQPDSLIGTDISEGMMNVGREKVKQAHLSNKISFVREDCTSPPRSSTSVERSKAGNLSFPGWMYR